MSVSDLRKMPISSVERYPRLIVGMLAVGALLLGALLGKMSSPNMLVALTVVVGIALLLVLRLDAPLGGVVVAVAIVMDYYQLLSVSHGFPLFSMSLMLLVIAVFYFYQSAAQPWVPTKSLWLWGLLCALVALAIPRSVSIPDAFRYWLMIYVNGMLAYVIGTQIARNFARFRRLLIAVSVVGVGMGLHAILFEFTGTFLFENSLIDGWLATKSNYLIPGTTFSRATSFLLNPDSFGGIMEIFLPILLALGFVNMTKRWRAIAFGGAGVVAISIFFSYSTAAIIGAGAAVVVFGLLALRPKQRLYFIGLILAAPLLTLLMFPSRMSVFIDHATSPRERDLRMGVWQTGWNIITHLPLTGIGLGKYSYMAREDPYRSPTQDIIAPHPHNSFLEIGAMVGVPALIVFLLLLGFCLWRAFQNYRLADTRQRVLIGSVLAAIASLTVNSLASPGWTMPPASVLIWMLLGAAASPWLLGARATGQPTEHAATSPEPAPALRPNGESTG